MTNPAASDVGGATERLLSVRKLLRGTVIGPERQSLGEVVDVAVRLRDGRYPLVIGVQARVDGDEEFLPDSTVARWCSDAVELIAEPDRRSMPERDGTVLMCSELLGQRLSDLQRGRRVHVRDIVLEHLPEGWVLSRIDIRGWAIRTLGLRTLREGSLDWKAIHSRVGYELNR
jgi:hypothetical protein